MVDGKKESDMVYEARLHWIIFMWPIVLFCLAGWLGYHVASLRTVSYGLLFVALFWEFVVWLTYESSYLMVKKKQVLLRTGIFVRQTIVITLDKIESIDIRQPILGTIFRYGSLIITGTGGTRQVINYLDSPLTCRRYIEQMLHP